jgi:CBS domain-containing protein
MRETVRDLMTTQPVTVEASRPVPDAARAMRDGDIGDVLVTENGRLLGMLTDRDIVIRVLAEGRDPGRTPVGQVCSRELTTLRPDEAVDAAIAKMRERAVRRLPVVEDGRPVGVVSLGDLAVDRDPRSALGEISEAPPNR